MSQGIWLKRSLAIAIAASTALLVGCGEELPTSANNQSENQNTNHVSVNNPRGSITGLVTDTNGLPIEGATVYLGNQTAITNSGGQYYFSDIAVSQTVLREDNNFSQAVALTIAPPAGYLGATVTVLPQAQIFMGNDDTNSLTNPTTTFIDGFNASAGIAVLPATTATVSGVLRNIETGEPVVATTVALDMLRTQVGVDQEQPQNGVNTSYGVQPITAITGTDGKFTFTKVPADSILRLAANGYTVSAEADTANETVTFNMGNVDATPITSADSIAPWVSSVLEVVDQTAGRGLLSNQAVDSFRIVFSEKMSALNSSGSSVLVRDVNANKYLPTASITLNGNMLTIQLQEELEAGHEIDVLLLSNDLRDQASPSNALSDKKSDGNDTIIGFDDILETTVGSTYVRLKLKAYIEASNDAETVNLDDAQTKTDPYGVASLALLQQMNSALLDVDNEKDGIQQLNSAKDDNESEVSDAAERLSALASSLAATVDYVDSTEVQANVAGISFAASDAAFFELDVIGSNNKSKLAGLVSKRLTGAEFDTYIDENDDEVESNRFYSNVAIGEDIFLVVHGVVPGDIVTITPFDEFGYAGNASSLTLVDNVAPTTILQTAYGVNKDDNSGLVTSLQYGNGGEQSALSEVEPGTPILNITPRLLSIVDGTVDGTDQLGVEGVFTLKPLFDLNTVNAINGDADFGNAFIDVLDFDANDIAASVPGVYDANAYASWAALAGQHSRTVGIAMSEEVVLNTNPVTIPAVTNATLENFFANNNVYQNDTAGVVHADLVQMDINNVLQFANLDHATVIDFTNSIVDLAGNAASNGAKVVVADAMPPLVTSAIYRGNDLRLVFNEAIQVDTTTTLVIGGKTITLDEATVNAFNAQAQADKHKLTVYSSAWFNEGTQKSHLDRSTVFSLAQYKLDDPSSTSFANDAFRHARLDFSDIKDARGNKWADYSTGATATDESFFFYHPEFAVVDETGEFQVTPVNHGTVIGSNVITVRFNSNHVFDVADWNPDSAGNLVNYTTMFSIPGNTIDATGSNNVRVVSAGKSIEVTLVVTNPVAAGNTIEFSQVVKSAWDNTETVPVTSTRITF